MELSCKMLVGGALVALVSINACGPSYSNEIITHKNYLREFVSTERYLESMTPCNNPDCFDGFNRL